MAKTNAKENGDPDPIWSQLAEMRTMIGEMSTRIHRMNETVKEMQESLKEVKDTDESAGKKHTP
jgi:methyl-accepting chemotaxis protein